MQLVFLSKEMEPLVLDQLTHGQQRADELYSSVFWKAFTLKDTTLYSF